MVYYNHTPHPVTTIPVSQNTVYSINIVQFNQNFIHFPKIQDGSHLQQTITRQLKRPLTG